jgi:hypothetical protein
VSVLGSPLPHCVSAPVAEVEVNLAGLLGPFYGVPHGGVPRFGVSGRVEAGLGPRVLEAGCITVVVFPVVSVSLDVRGREK